jgi:hypothetical protein
MRHDATAPLDRQVPPVTTPGLRQPGAGTGLASVDERDTTCCYAQQDKFWVQGAPDGERWEIYTVLADSQTFYDAGQASPECCGGDSRHSGEPTSSSSSWAATCC